MRKVSRSRKFRLLLIAFASVFIFLVAAANAAPRKGEKPSLDWSRSLPVGQDVSGSIGLSVGDGQQTHMIWTYQDEEDQRFRFIRLNDRGEIVSGNHLQLPGHIRTPRLLPAGDETLHLLWASRHKGGANWQLWHILLTTDGQPIGKATRVSPIGGRVGKFVVASASGDQVVVAWDRASQGGLVMRWLDQDGLPLSDAILVSQDGERPSLKVDPTDQTHLAWLRDGSFYYAAQPLQALGPIQGTVVVDADQWGTLSATGDSLDGPELGYADGWIYIFSSVVSNSDHEAGSGIAEYIAFPAGSPSASLPRRLWVLPVENQPYEPFQSNLALTELSRPLTIQEAAGSYGRTVDYVSDLFGDWTELTGAASNFTVSPSSMIGDSDQLAMAMAISQDDGWGSQMQIATLLFDDGHYLGYSITSRTDALSNDPALAVDDQGNLHLAWREGAWGKGVSYATTVPAARSNLDRLAASDFTYLVLQGGLDTLVSIMLLPLAGWWVVPGLLLLVLYARFRQRAVITEPVAWIPLITAVTIYLGMKFLFLPTITTYVPFSAWLPLPSMLNEPIRLGVPLVTLLVAILVANKVRLRYSTSAVSFYVALAMTDAVLTLAVYGVNYMGEL